MEINKIPAEKKLFIDYLSRVIPFYSSKLVGKIFKRFDVIQDKEVLRLEIRELVYEHFRELKELVEAYGEGVEMSFFSFTKSETKNKEGK
jgi:hypothetical protein